MPLALWSYSSISSSFMRMNQASSSRRQVVMVTSSIVVVSPERNLMFLAQPRRPRGAYSHSASGISPERDVMRKSIDGPEKLAP